MRYAILLLMAASWAADPATAQERPDWVEETPGRDTTCAFDTPYRFYISGSPEWRPRTYALLDSIAARLPGFRSYVAPGSDHGLLRTDVFYTYESSDVPLAEWIGDLIAGEQVENVRCVMCSHR